MNKQERWDIQYRNHGNPVFIAEKETMKIRYYNEKFRDLFHLQRDSVGENFLDVITYRNITLETPFPSWEEVDFFESKAVHEPLNQQFHLVATVTLDGGSIFGEIQNLEESEDGNQKFEEAMNQCVSIFQLPKEEIIPAFVKLLCDYYQCHSAYINRVDEKKQELLCEFQWCSDPDFQASINAIVTKNTPLLFQWMNTRGDSQVLEIDIQHEQLDALSQEVLTLLSLDNVTACHIENDQGEVVAVVGLNNRQRGFMDYRLLKTVATFVGQGVNQAEMVKTLQEMESIESLTGFFNRSCYSQIMSELEAYPPNSLGIIFVNINGLKEVNETAGYHQGDLFIQSAAEKVKQHLPCQFFRVSGDEFVGVAPNISQQELENMGTSLQRYIREEHDYHFAVGYTYGSRGFTLSRLLQEAETMMFINKQDYYSSSKRQSNRVKDSTLGDLLHYLSRGDFMVYLQPQVLLKDGSLCGAEALIRRFDQDEGKMVFPDQFIPLYEKKSVIRHVDMFVLDTVCALLKRWHTQGTAVPISVNFSRVTLQEYGIVENIVDICDKHQVPHHLVVVEVTERMGLIENNVPSKLIQQFKAEGFRISLDDFGCAYSNIVTLAKISVDEVKIDKSLVDDLLISEKNQVIVDSMLSMCHRFPGTSTLAEGIETQEQADFLRECHCHLGQGYLYSRPIPVEEFEEKYSSYLKL